MTDFLDSVRFPDLRFPVTRICLFTGTRFRFTPTRASLMPSSAFERQHSLVSLPGGSRRMSHKKKDRLDTLRVLIGAALVYVIHLDLPIYMVRLTALPRRIKYPGTMDGFGCVFLGGVSFPGVPVMR